MFLETSFDAAAFSYDNDFTLSEIGKMQRKSVYDFLESKIISTNKLSILEINCGTGEDAVWLANKGNSVMATDASAKMIDVARQKISSSNKSNLQFQQADFSSLKEKFSNKKFDLIFSNFGGLNCVDADELKNLLQDFTGLLNPGGKLVMVIMGRKCLWEILYFILKGQFKKAFRRSSKKAVSAHLGNGVFQNTWYFSPSEISGMVDKQLKLIGLKPIGFFVPPSYLEKFFSNKMFFLRFLFRLEKIFSNFSIFADYADHYFISFKRHE